MIVVTQRLHGCRIGITLRTVNCKGTWEGTYRFWYEVERGGGGICDSPTNAVVACQEPGSVYVDNQVFRMFFGRCPMVSTSMHEGLSSAFRSVMGPVRAPGL